MKKAKKYSQEWREANSVIVKTVIKETGSVYLETGVLVAVNMVQAVKARNMFIALGKENADAFSEASVHYCMKKQKWEVQFD